MKIGSVAAELFHADGDRTCRYDEANSRVSRFATNTVISSRMRAQLSNQLCYER
jgi:hypothetical protein